MNTDLPQHHLTIFLIKEDFERDSIIDKLARVKHIPFTIGDFQCDLYVRENPLLPPQWASLFDGFVEESEIGRSRSLGAALVLESSGRVFALTFGSGRYLLNLESFEERFGLKVVLNSVSKVRSIDKRTFDAIAGQTKTQAIRDTSVMNFGIDVERDLLRAMTGSPIDTELGSRMSGIDSLSVDANLTLDYLPDLLAKYYTKSTETTYQEGDFAFIDQIRAISEKGIVKMLDEVLVEKLTTRDFEPLEIEMAIPEIIDFTEFNQFRYSRSSDRSPTVKDINIADFLEEADRINADISPKWLRTSRIFAVRGEGDVVPKWSTYKCLYADLMVEDNKYILSDGNWYKIDVSFVKALDEDISQIPLFDKTLPDYKHDDEGAYNKAISTDFPDYFLFDKDLIHPQRGQKIEFCDLYYGKDEIKDLIHIKRGKSSASLSHLFFQGTVSGEVFLGIPDCRRQINEKLPLSLKLRDYAAKPESSKYRIVYGVIGSHKRALPFFSRVSLRQSCRRLDLMNYNYAIAYISEDEIWAKTKKIPTKKTKTKT